MLKIKLPDGNTREIEKGKSVKDLAYDIGEGLGRAAIAGEINGKLVDLSTTLEEDSELRIITFKDKEGVEIFRHSSAHILAAAVLELFPDAKPTIGPAVEEGFYYDFDCEPFHPQDLERIEEKMKEIVKKDIPFQRIELSRKDANIRFNDNSYKIELISELDDEPSAYKLDNFLDLCRGPHVPSTGMIKAIKLTKLAGAYWKGDSKNKQLQRIYGISFPDKKMLKKHLFLIEEAEKRDHKKLGKQLELFSMHEEGAGFPFFLPNGVTVWNILLDLWREEHKKAGYVEIKTPAILNRILWEKSGHWENYRENMYTLQIDNQDFAIKPMNCPGGMLVYKEKVHSYREFPLRVGEIGHVHRHELSGVLSGLFRVRAFHQDDAHIFMTKEQITQEVLGVLNLTKRIYSIFGLSYHLELSTRPEKSIGSDEQWEEATNGLRGALEESGEEYKVNEGDGAFYGPKIDIHIKDAIGRTWQCGTIQLDMSLPERFDLKYEGKDGKQHRPVMIHRVIYGSLERFFGILIEHFAGKFPLWLAPVQVKILTVAERFNGYALKVKEELEKAGLRVEIDLRAESVSYKVREAQSQKIPLIINIGEKEEQNNTVAIRTLDNKLHFGVKPEDLVSKALENIKSKELSFSF